MNNELWNYLSKSSGMSKFPKLIVHNNLVLSVDRQGELRSPMIEEEDDDGAYDISEFVDPSDHRSHIRIFRVRRKPSRVFCSPQKKLRRA